MDSMMVLLRRLLGGFAAVSALALCQVTLGQNGTWIDPYDGSWTASGNWASGTIANGANNTADFSTLDIDAQATLNNVAPAGDGTGFPRNGIDISPSRTIGHMIFGDTNTATPGGFEVYNLNAPAFGEVLTLAGSAPSITVHELGSVDPTTLTFPSGVTQVPAGIIDDVLMNAYIAGSNGFTKFGDGILTLAATSAPDAFEGNRLNGTVTIAEGTLRLASTFTYYDAFDAQPETQSIDEFRILDGGTLELDTNNASNITMPANATATLIGDNGSFVANVTAEGDSANPSVVNVVVLNRNTATSEQFSAHGDWTGIHTLNISGTVDTMGGTNPLDNFRLRPNGGDFGNASFAETVVNLDNVRLVTRSNSFGNNIAIAELHGTSSTEIAGGVIPGGVARYFIGGNDQDSDHAGAITSDSGGLDLIKEGAGTLTLSGALTYSPVNTAEGGQAGDPARRGGITTIAAGTLAVTGTTSLPAGLDDTGSASNLGLLWSTVDIQSGATLDVSGATGTYSTVELQQVIGSGTIAGNYNHDEGRIAPGDDNAGTSADLVRTAGTLNFANDLVVNGGEILYDMGTTPSDPHDMLEIGGQLNLGTGGVITPNFLGAVPTTGTYTVATTVGGITGSPGGWSVAWPGRGAGPTVTVSGNDLVFDAVPVTGGADLEWRGDAGTGDWDIQSTANFHNPGTGADVFFDGDNVTFADTFDGGTAVANYNVNLAQDVQPTSITVDSTNDYTFGGPGGIVGFATLTKRGTSTLTITRNNTYSGATTIESGTVDIGANTGALGTGVLTMSGSTLRVANDVSAGITNSSLVVTASTSNTVVANGSTGAPANNPVTLPSLAGSGDLTITTEVPPDVDAGRLVDLSANNSTFSGSLTLEPDGINTTLMGVRFAGDTNSGIPNGTLHLAAGVTLSQRTNNVSTVPIGALSGDAGSTLGGFAGGGTPQNKIWEIGALGTSTAFAGNVADGNMPSTTSITKVGAGSLSLTGDLTYTGDTRVEGGVLSITSADNLNLGDDSTVFISSGAMFDLDFSGNDTVNFLYLGGVPQSPGIYNSGNSGGLITGSGGLNVLAMGPSLGLPGDFNDDGVVNIGDYTLWRNNLGGTFDLNGNGDETGDSAGIVDQADYNLWKDNFGNAAAAIQFGSVAVPEPSTLTIVGVLLSAGVLVARRRLVM